MAFSVECSYCAGPDNVLMAFSPGPGQDQAEFDAAWKAVMSTYASIGCPGCGAQFALEDDPAGSVKRRNVSRPKITSLSIGSGSRTGGEFLYINGSALDVGNLVVKFGDEPVVSVSNRTATLVKVVTPVGQFRLNVVDRLVRVIVPQVTGAFMVGDTVTFGGTVQATLKHIDLPDYWVQIAPLVDPASLVGKLMAGPSGTGDVSGANLPVLIHGEGVRGLTSNAQGALRLGTSHVVYAPTGPFAPGEVVHGEASGAKVFLSSAEPYSGKVNVSVENDYGLRSDGGILADAFTYV